MTTKRFVAKHGLDNNNQTITNVASPVNATDVVTKNITDVIHNKANSSITLGTTPVTNYKETTVNNLL